MPMIGQMVRCNHSFIFRNCHIAETYFQDKNIEFDLVSCQFAFHYCFESLPQAETMLKNISENLKKGGFFIGTTPDSRDIMSRFRDATDAIRI